jgi:hypothetical protein
VTSWIPNVKKDPMPIKVEIDGLDGLLSSVYFPNDSKIIFKQAALLTALIGYCKRLVGENLVKDCEGIPPDPPFPNKSIFGGTYQLSAYYLWVNPYTKGYNCPVGYKPYLMYVYGTWNSVTHSIDVATAYMCLDSDVMDTTRVDPMNYFGGFYEISNSICAVGNPMDPSGLVGCNCPSGYTSSLFYTFNNGELNMYFCFNANIELTSSIMGGVWSAHSPNYYTDVASCPVGFGRYEMLSTTATHESMIMCLNNIFKK